MHRCLVDPQSLSHKEAFVLQNNILVYLPSQLLSGQGDDVCLLCSQN